VVERGERKLVTVLFVDLTGYTALSASLDPEDVYRFLRPGLLALQEIVEGFGGTVPHILGDGFMAVFGVPTAHEDDDERAVRAALAVREHVQVLKAESPEIPFPGVHAGVNSGEVMVAPSDERSGFAVIGDTVNTASRMADLAPEGTILVDERTHERTSHAIRFGPRRLRRAKGKAEPLATFEALDVRAVRERRGRASAFVDREDAVERVRRELRGASRASRSRVLLVTGEPGCGKTRLAAELRRRRLARVLAGRCPAFGHQLPLHALAEAVASGLRIDPGGAAGAMDDAAREVTPRIRRADRASFARDLRLLLGAERVPKGEARRSVHEAARAARTAIEALAADRPLVIVIDDFQWADADLLRFLRDVEADPLPAAVLFLPLSRPRAGVRGVPTMELELLGAADMRAIARDVLGPEVPEEALEETLSRAGGNPLFLEETLGMLVEAGTLEQRGTEWRVTDPQRLRGVPSSLRRLIAARLDGLPPEEKSTLQDAAVAGDVSWDRLLEHLAGGAAIGPVIRSLTQRGLLVRREPGLLPDALEYEVRHVLIREVAYESVPRRERSSRHFAIAEWLRHEGEALQEEPIAWLAHHYERAWDLSRSRTGAGHSGEAAVLAVHYLGRWADRTFSYQARLADAIYERALGVARAADSEVDAGAVADLLVGRAESLIEMGRHREALAGASQAHALADRLGDRRRRARALLALGRTESDLGRMARARRLLEDARRLFESIGDVRGQAWALHRRSETWSSADYRREIDDLEASYRLFSRARDRWGRSIVAQDLAYLLSARGGAPFRNWYERASRLAGDERDLRSQAALARTEGYAAFYRGQLSRAATKMREARPLAVHSGDRYAEADALLIEAMAEAAVGSPAEADRLADELLRLARELRSARLHALGLLAGSRAAVRLGQTALATRRLTSARRLIARHRQAVTTIDLHVADGWIRLDRGQFTGIGVIAGRASSSIRRHGLDMLEPVGALMRGRAALGLGATSAAVRDLGAAKAIARRLGGTGHLALAEVLEEQARLLSGTHRSFVHTVADADPEIDAIAQENASLRSARSDDPGRARTGFEEAAATWERLGATAWLARALAMASASARSAGDPRAASDLAHRSEAILGTLRTPARDRARIFRAVELVLRST
jgi:class 3 adenylate cyclase/tetratricopeptide (TPR) repeat protein